MGWSRKSTETFVCSSTAGAPIRIYALLLKSKRIAVTNVEFIAVSTLKKAA